MSTFSDIKGFAKEILAARRSKKKSKEMLSALALSRAKKQFKTEYGRDFSMKMYKDTDKMWPFFKAEKKKLKKKFFK